MRASKLFMLNVTRTRRLKPTRSRRLRPTRSRRKMKNPWSELPDEIIAKIQARLPLVSLLRSRAVCRAWDAAVDSPGFLQERLESGAGARDCALLVAGVCQSDSSKALSSCVYDPASDRWYQVRPPPWLGRTLEDSKKLLFLSEQGVRKSTGELAPAWADGAMVLANLQPAGVQQTVYAYIRDRVARSSPTCVRIWHVRGLFVDPVAKCFKLVVVDDVHPGAETIVFDSALRSWCVTTLSFPPCNHYQFLSDRVPHFLAGQGVFVGTVLYCLVANGNLLAYDLERASWSWLAVAKPTLFDISLYSNLIKVRDRLLCAAVVCHGVLSGLQIWEMNFERMAWTQVDTMPAPMFSHFGGQGLSRGFNYRYKPSLQAVAGRDEAYIMHEKVDKIAALHLLHAPAAWRWLPSLPYKDFVNKSYYCLHPLHPWLEFDSFMLD